MALNEIRRLGDDDLKRAWDFYAEVFAEVDTLAAQRHLMTDTEFSEVCADERIRKYLVVDDDTDTIVGMSTLTNHLDAVPLISPRYFARHWPEHYDRGAIWYCGFVGARGSLTAFRHMVVTMWKQIRSNNGISFQDYCLYNAEQLQLPQVAERFLNRAGYPVAVEQVDAQTFWKLAPTSDTADAELERAFLSGDREVIV